MDGLIAFHVRKSRFSALLWSVMTFFVYEITVIVAANWIAGVCVSSFVVATYVTICLEIRSQPQRYMTGLT